MMAATMFAASCSDFDDYNEAYVSGSAESKLSLWENISGNPELSQFSELLKKGGYDEVLGSSRFYTVWAPKNGTITDYEDLMAMGKDSLVNRFIKNHIANYNYNISAAGERRVYTLNDKSMVFDNSSYAGLTIDPDFKNVPSVNGILHVIDGYAKYHPNLYECIFESECDSLSKYFKKFEYEYFDAAKSVIGPIDSLGRQTYSDSVIIDKNRLTDSGNSGLIRAELANEDSLYTLLIPTDEAYKAAYDKVRAYYRYPASEELKYLPLTSDGVGKEQIVQVKSEYQSDSLARMQIARVLAYSHGNVYNSLLPEEETPVEEHRLKGDTICSSYRYYISNGSELLAHTVGEVQEQSNGYARVIDSLAVLPWDVWCPEISLSLYNTDVYPYFASCQQPVRHNVVDNSYGPYVTHYLQVDPIGNTSRPEIYFNLSGVRAASYNVYVVFLPAAWRQESADNKIVQFDANFSYMGEDGKMKTLSFTKQKAFATKDLDGNPIVNEIDTFKVGTIDFPYSYVGTDANPYFHLKINRNNYSSTEKGYGQTFRIAAIILRPVEYDEYLKNKE